MPRQELYDRINARVEAMFAAGLVDEVRGLRELPHPLSREAGQALGYKEVVHAPGRPGDACRDDRSRPDQDSQLRQTANHMVSSPSRLPPRN